MPDQAKKNLDDPGHLTLAFGALAHQQQVASLGCVGEVGDGRCVAAMAAPDVGQQALADVGGLTQRERLLTRLIDGCSWPTV